MKSTNFLHPYFSVSIKILVILSILCFKQQNIYATNFYPIQTEWTKIDDPTPNSDIGLDVIQTMDGNIITAATLEITSITNTNVRITKYDQSGNILWVFDWGGSQRETVGEIKELHDGTFIIVGSTQSYATQGQEDFYLLKLRDYGTYAASDWVKVWGTPSSDIAYAVDEYYNATDGWGFIIGGAEGSSGWVKKANAIGMLNWSGTYGSRVLDIEFTKDEGFIFIYDITGYQTARIRKMQYNGSLVWENTINAQYANNTYPRAVKEVSDGGYIVTGYGYDGSFNAYGAFLYKTNNNGSVEWNQTYNNWGWGPMCNSTFTWGYDVVETATKGFIVVGSADTGNPNPIGRGAFYLKVNSLGQVSNPYGTGNLYANTWLHVEDDGNDANYSQLYAIIPANDCGDSFITIGYNTGSSSSNHYIRVSKFFDTDYNNETDYDYLNVNINVSTSWSSNKSVAGTITVKSGRVLTLNNNMVLQMGLCGKIIIEKGGFLNIGNATITSMLSYNKSMWDGIEVWGDRTLNQLSSSNQGKVVMNQALIENAHCAVRLYKKGEEWLQNGGIVQSTKTVFKNNRSSIEFKSYKNINPVNLQELQNLSFLSECTFTCTAPMRADKYIINGIAQGVNYHVKMTDVKNIKILGCTFNNVGSFQYDQRGTGIISENSDFKIGIKCTIYQPWPNPCSGIRSKFEGLYVGVSASSLGGATIANISETDFINNNLGIILNATSYGFIIRNKFRIPKMAISLYPMSAGIALIHADKFHIEDNEFSTYNPGYIDNFGILSFSSGTNAGLIYKNIFNSINQATYFYNNNPAVRIDCNKFQLTENDITVMAGNIAPQGGCSSIVPPAHNEFHIPCPPNQILHQVSPPPSLNYITELGFAPSFSCITTSEILVASCVYGVTTNSCPSSFTSSSQVRLKINKTNEEIKKLKLKIDYDETKNILSEIKNVKNSTQNLKKLLFSKEYLSDEVLITLLKHEPQFPESIISELILKNAPLSDNLQSLLLNRIPNLSANFKAKLVKSQNKNNTRQLIINNLKIHLDELNRLNSLLINTIIEEESMQVMDSLLYNEIKIDNSNLELGLRLDQKKLYSILNENALINDSIQFIHEVNFYNLVNKYQEKYLGLKNITIEDRNDFIFLGDVETQSGIKAKNIIKWVEGKKIDEISFTNLEPTIDNRYIGLLVEKIGMPIKQDTPIFTIKMYSEALKSNMLEFIKNNIFKTPEDFENIQIRKESDYIMWTRFTNHLKLSINNMLDPDRLNNIVSEMEQYQSLSISLNSYLSANYDGIWKFDTNDQQADLSLYRLTCHKLYIQRIEELLRSKINSKVRQELLNGIIKLKYDLTNSIKYTNNQILKGEYEKSLALVNNIK